VPGPAELCLGGKLNGRAVIAAATVPGQPGRLGLLIDDSSKTPFLIDTGSVYSIVPYNSSTTPTGPSITSANGKPIACWGTVQRTIRVGKTTFTWTFLQAAISFHIVGADFLAHFGLTVDLKWLRLLSEDRKIFKLKATPSGSVFASIGVRPATPLRQHLDHDGSTSSPSTCSSSTAAGGCGTGLREGVVADAAGVGVDDLRTASTWGGSASDYEQLLQEFCEVVNPSKQLPKVKHVVQHHIETVGRPVCAKYRRLDASKLKAAKAEFMQMEQQGIVRISSSDWASPLHMVRKADGSWRPCGDFRRLNAQTQPDRYTCPNIGDLTARLAGCKVFFFSKLDLRKGYHQVPVRPADTV